MSSPKRDIVLFLGAGFSYDAGLPVMSRFGHASKQDYNGILKHASADRDSSSFRHAAPMLVESGEVFRQFQRFCRQSPTLRDFEVENIETVFCIAEALREAGQKSIDLNNQSYAIEVLIVNIQLWLWKVYQQCPLLNQTRNTNEEVYKRFFALLKELEIAGKITVITTNYDLIYEYLSWKNAMPFVYPLYDAGQVFAGNDSTSYFSLEDGSGSDETVICKLHGSVNYFYDNSISKKDNLFVSNDLFEKTPIGKSCFRDRRPAIFALEAIWNIRKKYGDGFTPAIIPPTYAKLTGQPWLRKIWNRAFHAIRTAKKIVFIGYSMPDSDGFMRALIHSAMAFRASRNVVPPQIFVIDSSQETHHRYKQLFRGIYKETNPLSLSEATKSIIPEILRKNDC